jgi:hypothetical protein
MKIDYEEYFELSGSIKRGNKYSLNSKDESAHICINCFIKHFNLSVLTAREPIGIENQEGVVKRMIEDTKTTCSILCSIDSASDTINTIYMKSLGLIGKLHA